MYDRSIDVTRLVVGVVPLLFVIRQAHFYVLTSVYDPSMGVTTACRIAFVWHYRKLILCGCEAERVLVPVVSLMLFWFGMVGDTYSCQMLLAGSQGRSPVLEETAA